jgi:hypothetical protein
VRVLIWIVFLGGLFLAIFFWGQTGRLIYLAVMAVILALFRRSIVLALTHLASRFGLMRDVTQSLPAAIHLARASGPTAAARPVLDALASCKFADAGSWNIVELPTIQVSLMVQPELGILAAVESASPIGAQLNLHTLYPDGRVVSFTNSELPPPRATRPNVTRTQVPRCSPSALVTRARNQRPNTPYRDISIDEAPRLYEQLYAEEAQFRKAVGS